MNINLVETKGISCGMRVITKNNFTSPHRDSILGSYSSTGKGYWNHSSEIEIPFIVYIDLNPVPYMPCPETFRYGFSQFID